MKRLHIQVIIGIIGIAVLASFIIPKAAVAEERLAIKAGVANLRSGPGTDADVLWQVEQFHPVIIVEKKGNWYKIQDFENDVAWLHNSLLTNIDTVISIKDNCNVRSEPNANASILFTVERGVPFKVLERKENWIKIEHADGDVGWIYQTLVW